MNNFRLKTLPILLVYIFSLFNEINCQFGASISISPFGLFESKRTEKNSFNVENIFNEKSNIKTGDIMECEVTKLKNLESSKTDVHVFTQVGAAYSDAVFYPASKDKKCFSFEVRTKVYPHILLSATPSTGNSLDVILEYTGNSVIRKDTTHVSTAPTPGIVNEKELRGFWIRWLDDQLLEVGRGTDNYPILSYRVPEKLFINFIGIFSYTAVAEWIIHKEPKCGQYNVTEKTIAETKCEILTKSNLHKNNILDKFQTHILNQIKNQYEIFKLTKFRSKTILLVYQQLITKHFKDAEKNQNQIYASDNEIYCPLKSKIFNEITKLYFQFLEELEIDLSTFQETTEKCENVNTNFIRWFGTDEQNFN